MKTIIAIILFTMLGAQLVFAADDYLEYSSDCDYKPSRNQIMPVNKCKKFRVRKKIKFTKAQDLQILECRKNNIDWFEIAELLSADNGISFSARQIKERFKLLDPKKIWTLDEDLRLIQKYNDMQSKNWVLLASVFPKRNVCAIKNRYNFIMKKINGVYSIDQIKNRPNLLCNVIEYRVTQDIGRPEDPVVMDLPMAPSPTKNPEDEAAAHEPEQEVFDVFDQTYEETSQEWEKTEVDDF